MGSINLVLVEMWDEMNVVHRSDAEESKVFQDTTRTPTEVAHEKNFKDWSGQRE